MFEVAVDLIVVQGNNRAVANWEKMESIIKRSLSESDSDEVKASIIHMFIDKIKKIDINNVSSSSRSLIRLFKTLTKGLSS
jgi:hypothetical protein